MSVVLPLVAVFLKACGLATLLLVLRGLVWVINLLAIAPPFDPLRRIPGPSASFFQSHLVDIMNPQRTPDTHESWRKAYGNTFRFHGFGRHDYRLISFDFRAITHILTSPVYEKPWQTRSVLSRLIGRGIFSMEGVEHKAQRKIISPAFSAQSIKNLVPIFFSKAEELCNIWEKLLPRTDDATIEASASASVDVAHWITRASFDIIGLGGFDYAFDSLNDESEIIHMAYRRMFRTADKGIQPRDLLEMYFPITRSIWPTDDTKTIKESMKEIEEAGRRIIARKKAKILANQDCNNKEDKDLLTLLIKSNLSTDVSKRLSDSELLDQCNTFLLAGSDSVSVAIAWCLHFLSIHPEIQARLYAEVKAAQSCKGGDDYESDDSNESFDSGFMEEPSLRTRALDARNRAGFLDAIESLPYLDNVVRETLRLSPPVHSTIRTAVTDDEIPLSEPISIDGGPATAKSFKIRKGSLIHIPIEGINYAEDLWGSDARDFNPDRWEQPSKASVANFPGIGNLMTFGYGPHSCLGYKFTISEMKVLLATLLSRFEFTPVEGIKVAKFNSILTRPYVVGHWDKGAQLPIQVTRRA